MSNDYGFAYQKMSNSIVRLLDELAENENIFKLLYYIDKNGGLDNNLDDDPLAKEIFEKKEIIKHKGKYQKIKPYPFSTEAQKDEEIFIRTYFNQGTVMHNEEYSNFQINIDIITSHNVWLTSYKEKKMKMIRPYAVLNEIIGIIKNKEKDKIGTLVGFQHMTVNQDYECLRLYVDVVDIIYNEIIED